MRENGRMMVGMRKIMPTIYFWLTLILIVGTYLIAPDLKYLPAPYHLLGVLPILFGIVLNLWTDRLFKKHKTTVKPHRIPEAIITYGPFGLSRHPMYLGMAAILLGVSMLTGVIQTLIFPVMFVMLMDSIFIPMEEANSLQTFGKEYRGYKSRVRKWC